jgi:hypothetical protein
MDDDNHGWNHLQCTHCWYREWGVTREPCRVKDDDPGQCCFCGAETASGIYRRVQPGDRTIPFCPDAVGFIYSAGLSRPRTPPRPTDSPGCDE